MKSITQFFSLAAIFLFAAPLLSAADNAPEKEKADDPVVAAVDSGTESPPEATSQGETKDNAGKPGQKGKGVPASGRPSTFPATDKVLQSNASDRAKSIIIEIPWREFEIASDPG